MSQPYPTDIEAICNHCEQRYADADDLSKFRIGQRVRYIPGHAHGDRNHPDCEDGIVRSFNPHGKPFVVYDNATRGRMLTLKLAERWTAACTDPSDLVALTGKDKLFCRECGSDDVTLLEVV